MPGTVPSKGRRALAAAFVPLLWAAPAASQDKPPETPREAGRRRHDGRGPGPDAGRSRPGQEGPARVRARGGRFRGARSRKGPDDRVLRAPSRARRAGHGNAERRAGPTRRSGSPARRRPSRRRARRGTCSSTWTSSSSRRGRSTNPRAPSGKPWNIPPRAATPWPRTSGGSRAASGTRTRPTRFSPRPTRWRRRRRAASR